MKKVSLTFLFLFALCSISTAQRVKGYKNFKVSVYVTVHDVQKSSNLNWFKRRIAFLQRYVHIDKVYLETYRGNVYADSSNIIRDKKYLENQGIQVAGGIAFVKNGPHRFQSFCYSNKKDVAEVKHIVTYTAHMFNEIILDDFFFDDCKCNDCIIKKGDQSWSKFRLKQVTDVAKNVIVKTAKEINPNIKMVIKFPNWYEHFHYLGYNLKEEPKFFDGIYTGTETRDPAFTDQHLQPYESYAIMRYFDNVAPGKNGGGWVDPFNRGTIDRYGEQLELTLLAKPKQVNLFELNDLMQTVKESNGSTKLVSDVAPEAGYEFDKADTFLGELGKPVGIENYRPYDSSGEDFLPNYLGMLGIPIDITPHFPTHSQTILLTEDARKDPDIISKIKKQLMEGKHVVITSGLFKALQGRGIRKIIEARYTGRTEDVHKYSNFQSIFYGKKDILIPQIIYPTNDSWEVLSAFSGDNGFPMLLKATFGKGTLYILTIPENFSDLYNLPEKALNVIKSVLMEHIFVRTESPAKVGLFVYDNHTFVVHSFLTHPQSIKIVVDGKNKKLQELTTGRTMSGVTDGNHTTFKMGTRPHQYSVFKIE
ncbi:MAG TPA: hypothetical protein VKA34_20325 [Balneolales bacterium]|nr:hypothetical protein [Balneolales bacterium]